VNLLGKLSWSSVPINEPIDMIASGLVILTVMAILIWITVRGHWPYLWKE
jgi:cytochrome o ubiquinol oxidase subunit I